MGNKSKNVRLLVSMPGKVVMDERVEMVILSSVQGDIGILPGHEPASVILDNGPLRVRRAGETTVVLTVAGGFATVRDGVVNVMSPIADTPEHIEQAVRAIIAEREQNKLYEQAANLEVSRAESALRHILVRRENSTFAILKGRLEADGHGDADGHGHGDAHGDGHRDTDGYGHGHGDVDE